MTKEQEAAYLIKEAVKRLDAIETGAKAGKHISKKDLLVPLAWIRTANENINGAPVPPKTRSAKK